MVGKSQEFTCLNEITGQVEIKNQLDRRNLDKYELEQILNCEYLNASDFL